MEINTQKRVENSFPNTEDIARYVCLRYISMFQQKDFPISLSIQVNSKEKKLGYIVLNLRQPEYESDVELWSSVYCDLLDGEDLEYFIFRGHEYRAIVKPANTVSVKHLIRWMRKSIGRIYKKRMTDLELACARLEAIHEWIDQGDEGLF